MSLRKLFELAYQRSPLTETLILGNAEDITPLKTDFTVSSLSKTSLPNHTSESSFDLVRTTKQRKERLVTFLDLFQVVVASCHDVRLLPRLPLLSQVVSNITANIMDILHNGDIQEGHTYWLYRGILMIAAGIFEGFWNVLRSANE